MEKYTYSLVVQWKYRKKKKFLRENIVNGVVFNFCFESIADFEYFWIHENSIFSLRKPIRQTDTDSEFQ